MAKLRGRNKQGQIVEIDLVDKEVSAALEGLVNGSGSVKKYIDEAVAGQKIVFLTEDEYNALRDAGKVDEETKYMIIEEE